MFDFIEGKIAVKEPGRLVVQTSGIGFELKVSHQTMSSLPSIGEIALVYTSLQVREDDISLYGFSHQDERAFFALLIQVSGVGPKLALTILSAFPVSTTQKAIIVGDITTLSTIPGIGKKTAQRMVLELKDKLNKELFFDEETGYIGAIAESAERAETAQAIEALEALGYTRTEILKVFAGKEMDVLAAMGVEGLIKMGLQALSRY